MDAALGADRQAPGNAPAREGATRRRLSICPRSIGRRNIAVTNQKWTHHGGTVAVGHDQRGRSPGIVRRRPRASCLGPSAAPPLPPLAPTRPLAAAAGGLHLPADRAAGLGVAA